MAESERLELSDSREKRFEALYRAHYSRVLSYALRRVPPELANDVVADTFLVAWRRLDRVPDHALPWLLGVARKTLGNYRRSAKRQNALFAELKARDVLRARTLGVTPDDRESQRVADAYDRLHVRDREVLRLLIWDGLSMSEAAVVLGISEVTCRVRFHRAKRHLAARLVEAPSNGATAIRRFHSIPEQSD